MSNRQEATLTSPTGGYVVVALLEADGADDGWPHLIESLVDRGYVLAGVDGHRPAPRLGGRAWLHRLLEVVRGHHPVVHSDLVRAPEYDTETMAGFRTQWQPVGGGRPIELLSLTPKAELGKYAGLARDAEDS